MNRSKAFAQGFLIGVGAMYLLDPADGGRRRAMVRDKGRHALQAYGAFLPKAGPDALNHEGGRPAGEPPKWAQANWTPALTLGASLMGTAALIYGLQVAGRARRRLVARRAPDYAMLR